MTIRTAQVRLIDGTTVTVAEPAWCLGQHENGLHLVDLMHDGPETVLTVDTPHGPAEILNACLTKYPYATREDDRQTSVAVLLDSRYERFDPAGLYALADALTDRAVHLRALARQLTQVSAEENGR